LLFYDTASGKSRWLYADNDQEIASHFFVYEQLPARASEPAQQRATALILRVKSQAADPAATWSIAVASPDGRSVRNVADSVETLLGNHVVSSQRALVFYSRGGTARVLELDLGALTARSDAALEASP
jgi:hypothetical protein